jgi:GAF domain-containing protein
MSELYRAAAAVAVLGSDERHGALLQSIADVARALFRAEAATIFLLDDDAHELVFAAISGAGERSLIGGRLPANTGIAGWTLTTRQPLSVDQLSEDPRFSQESAESIGYVPNALIAVPILLEDAGVGVLEVLDPGLGRPVGQGDLALLGLFADQAAIALDLVRSARQAQGALDGVEGSASSAARLAELVGERSDSEAWTRVLDALGDALDADH